MNKIIQCPFYGKKIYRILKGYRRFVIDNLGDKNSLLKNVPYADRFKEFFKSTKSVYNIFSNEIFLTSSINSNEDVPADFINKTFARFIGVYVKRKIIDKHPQLIDVFLQNGGDIYSDPTCDIFDQMFIYNRFKFMENAKIDNWKFDGLTEDEAKKIFVENDGIILGFVFDSIMKTDECELYTDEFKESIGSFPFGGVTQTIIEELETEKKTVIGDFKNRSIEIKEKYRKLAEEEIRKEMEDVYLKIKNIQQNINDATKTISALV